MLTEAQASDPALGSDPLGAFVRKMLDAPSSADPDWGADRMAVVQCAASAIIKDIPPSDRQSMNESIAARHFTPAGRAAFLKWFSPQVIHGPIIDGSSASGGVLHYKDGTPVDLATENANALRIHQNALSICPELVQKYPGTF